MGREEKEKQLPKQREREDTAGDGKGWGIG